MAKQAVGTLVGKFFHIHDDDGDIKQQGRIMKDLGGGYFFVTLHSWVDGSPNTGHVVTMAQIADHFRFTFYENEKRWREAGDRRMK